MIPSFGPHNALRDLRKTIGFRGMITVIEANTDEIACACYWRAKPRRIGDQRKSRVIDAPQALKTFIRQCWSREIVNVARQVSNLAVGVDQSRPLAACFTVPYKFHRNLRLCLAIWCSSGQIKPTAASES